MKGYVVSTTCGTWSLGPGYMEKNQQIKIIADKNLAIVTKKDCYDHQYSIIKVTVNDLNLEKDEHGEKMLIRNELTVEKIGVARKINRDTIKIDNAVIHLEAGRSEKKISNDDFLPFFFKTYEDAAKCIQSECNLSLAYAESYDR